MSLDGRKVTASCWTRASVQDDTGWKYAPHANPSRGLHDYERFITFDGPLTAEEEKKLAGFIQQYDNPGYCSWSFRHLGDNRYKLTSTMDSSD